MTTENRSKIMLILSRKQGESIILAQDIKISVLEAQKGRIKLGIEAPADIPIYREEIYLSIKQQENSEEKEK